MLAVKNLNPKELVSILNIIFSNFDDLSTKYHIEKIKTIGDNYFAVSGLKSDGRKSASINLINMAKEMIITIKSINDSLSTIERSSENWYSHRSDCSGVLLEK